MNKSNVSVLFLFLFILGIASCSNEKYKVKSETDKNGYSYQTVTNDPTAVRIYTLKNGLKVYLSVNKDAPRIQTYVSVRAGSDLEPEESTGLAHYFEHLMFKGTDKLGTTDWAKEKVFLDEITDLFEQRRNTDDSIKKIKIFHQIDSVSVLAAQYAIPSEYDKLMSAIGARGTNAFTSYETTTYVNDIPSNEILPWLTIEAERFSNISLRLFHTELETVYEEFNMGQDRDSYKAYYALMGNLFNKYPLHRKVIGYAKDLKNPSIINIKKFYDKYYVPNNIAVIMCGDLNPDSTIQLIDKTFGKLAEKPFERPVLPREEPITKPIEKSIYGPDAEFLQFAYRFSGDSTMDKKYVTLIDMILNNSQAGLIDLDLVQQQKVLRAGCSPSFFIDYGMHRFYAYPKQGQTLEQARDLVLGEIEKVKKGEFDDWLIKAVINDLRLNNIRSQESNEGRADMILNTYVLGGSWADELKFYDELDKITKDQIVKFAQEHYKNNYVIIYKRQGEDKDVVKVNKPQITSINLNRNDQSAFFTEITKMPAPELKPVFVDFATDLTRNEMKPGMEFNYIKNTTNELFQLVYVIDMGKSHNKKLALAVNYMPYVGTDKYTPAQLQQEFYKLGLQFNVSTSDERSYVYITGLEQSFEPGIELLEHFLNHAKGDSDSYKNYVATITKQRENNKLNKDYILSSALVSYGKYGKFSPFTDILSMDEIEKIKPDELTNEVKEICTHKHQILYYGRMEKDKASELISKYHQVPATLADIPAPTNYPFADFSTKNVYFTNYDMVQANFILLTKPGMFDPALYPKISLYNEYYGSGLSSIFFQEIREAQGLAYSAYSYVQMPPKKERPLFVLSYVATQSDKFDRATKSMFELLGSLKQDERLFNLAKESIVKNIESTRITKTDVFWTYLSNLDKGINYDIRKDVYETVPKLTFDDMKTFFTNEVKPENYNLVVIGKKGMVDEKVLKKLGNLKELSREELFNY